MNVSIFSAQSLSFVVDINVLKVYPGSWHELGIQFYLFSTWIAILFSAPFIEEPFFPLIDLQSSSVICWMFQICVGLPLGFPFWSTDPLFQCYSLNCPTFIRPLLFYSSEATCNSFNLYNFIAVLVFSSSNYS